MSTEALEAQGLRGIEGSWAGGSDGMQVTNTFLEVVHVRVRIHCLLGYIK